MRGTTIRPAIEEMLIIIPSCCARMIGTTARMAAAGASTLSANTASTSALEASPIGAAMPIADPPSALIRPATSSNAGRFREASASRAPRRPNSSAIARPMPCEAPVTMTRASLNFTPPPLGEGLGGALMLAAATEVGRFTSRGQLGDAVTTPWALLLPLAVDRHEAAFLLVRLIFRLGLDRRDRRPQDFPGRRVQANHLIGLERGALAERQQFRLVQDLIRVGVANAGDERLVTQKVLELARVPPDPLRELG